MTILTVSGISKQTESDRILENISFKQRRLQRIAIAGETGSGKSTLLKAIAGLISTEEGEVVFEDQKIDTDRLVPGQPGIAYLSQHFELPKFLRVEQVLQYSNTLEQEEANLLYEVCRISHLLQRKTDQLSGGERQRIAIARLLISGPRLLLLDEPFTHLDMPHKNTLKLVIRDLGKTLGITCILVSHDPEDTLSWADKILVLRDGKLVQQGSPQKIYRYPVDEYTAGLFGKYNTVSIPYKSWAKFLGKRVEGKNIFLRPEELLIVDKKANAVSGVVRTSLFMGSHFETEVELEDHIVTINSGGNSYKKGQAVFVTLSCEEVWYV